MRERDQVKFVVCDKKDFDWATGVVRKYNINQTCTVLFSPSFEELSATDLADWILEARLPVRLQLQLHKLIWGDEPGH